jgi:uncharacterized protein (DUF1919 family)
MDKYKTAYISNTCTCIDIHRILNVEYNQPFIGSLFVNDVQYIKFCGNFDYYINCTPIIGKPNDKSIWAIQNQGLWYKHAAISIPYIIMYLDDIEIHWIHETDEKKLLESYNRRLDRYKLSESKPMFILSCSELINDHTENERLSLLKDFLTIKNSIYISKCPTDLELDNHENIILYDQWIHTSNERNSSHIYHYNDQVKIANIIVQHISKII